MINKFLFCLLLASPCFLWSQSAPTEKQAQELAKIHATTFKPLLAVFEADKTGQFNVMKSDLEAISKASDIKNKKELAREFERKHYEFYKKSFRAAKIDLNTYRVNIARVLGHEKFSLGEFGDIYADIIQPQGPFPIGFTASFSPPYTAGISEGGGNGITIICEANVGDDFLFADSGVSLIAGACRSKASCGDDAVIPGGSFSKMTVTTRSTEHYYGLCYSIGGYSQVNSKLGVRLKGSNFDKTIIVQDAWRIAPLLWVAQMEYLANDHLMQATFNGTFNAGSTFSAEIYAESFSLGVVLGFAGGFTQCMDISNISLIGGN